MARKKSKLESTESPAFVVGTQSSMEKSPIRNSLDFTTLGLFSIIAGLVVTAVSILVPFTHYQNFTPIKSTSLTVDLTIKSTSFLVATKGNPCDGIGAIAGIKTSKIVFHTSSPKWNGSNTIGIGILNNEGACKYRVAIPVPKGFSGGEVSVQAQFSFGDGDLVNGDVGTKPPYFPLVMNINLG